MRSPIAVAALITTLVLSGQPVQAQPSLEAINAEQMATFRESICPAPDGNTPFPPLASQAEDPAMTPARIFDNLYFVGNLVDSVWVLDTGEGYIVFDAMFAREVEPHMLAGMAVLGLDPGNIRYVVVAHGHGDHFGGAALLQQRYGAQVVMSNTEWHYLYDTQVNGNDPLPQRDVTVLDGDLLTLGDTTVKFVTTPGHTPGTISSVFEVKDGARRYQAGLWGGTAMNFLGADDVAVHRRSAKKFMALEPAIEVALSNHQYADGTLIKTPLVQGRAPGAPHPYVIGSQGFRDWMQVSLDCADAWLAQRASVQ